MHTDLVYKLWHGPKQHWMTCFICTQNCQPCLLTPLMILEIGRVNRLNEWDILSLSFSKCTATKTAQKQRLSMQMFEAAELGNAKAKVCGVQYRLLLQSLAVQQFIRQGSIWHSTKLDTTVMWQSNSFRCNSPRLLSGLGAVWSAVPCTGTSQLLWNAVLDYKT